MLCTCEIVSEDDRAFFKMAITSYGHLEEPRKVKRTGEWRVAGRGEVVVVKKRKTCRNINISIKPLLESCI